MTRPREGVQTVLVDGDRVVRDDEARTDMHRRAQERILDGAANREGFQRVDGTAPGFLDHRVGLVEGSGVGQGWLRRVRKGTVVSGSAPGAGPAEPTAGAVPG